jgi:hypothetical protein
MEQRQATETEGASVLSGSMQFAMLRCAGWGRAQSVDARIGFSRLTRGSSARRVSVSQTGRWNMAPRARAVPALLGGLPGLLSGLAMVSPAAAPLRTGYGR